MKYITRLGIVILISAAFYGCEEQEYFKSEGEIKKQLAYSWKEILMSGDTVQFNRYMMWTFKDEQLTIIVKKRSNDVPLDTMVGTYKINTTLTRVFMNTSGFPEDPAWYWLNAEWSVIYLNDVGLVIASEDPSAGGINEREFLRLD